MTKIEWTEQTWNPIVGCSIVSPGCTNCYAMGMAARIERIDEAAYRKRVEDAVANCGDDDEAERTRADLNNSRVPTHYAGTTKPSKAGPVWTGKLALAPDSIRTAPLHRRKATMYFVNSMSDLFHESVPDEWIDRVFAVMATANRHTYQVLTKRSERMRRYVSSFRGDGQGFLTRDGVDGYKPGVVSFNPKRWPLPNVWLGVSAERQQEADARIPDLLATPAAVRFVSAEPLLGPIDFTRIGDCRGPHDALGADLATSFDATLDWIIVGGESGTNARPMHPDWARAIRDQCVAADVPFFFKQWGEWTPGENVERQRGSIRVAYNDVPFDGDSWAFGSELLHVDGGHIDDEPTLYRVGKSEAGRLLDGREWSEYPHTAQRATEPAEAAG